MGMLLSSCVSIARSLRLHSTEALERLCKGHEQRVMVQRACWLLDCIDKEYALRTCKFEVRRNLSAGLPSSQAATNLKFSKMSWHSHIDYLIPQSGSNSPGDGQDLLLMRHRYANLCSTINRRRASVKGKPNTPISDKFDDIVESLRALHDEVPHDLQKMDPAMISRMDTATRRTSLMVCYYYHEALLLLCSQCMYITTANATHQDESHASAVYFRAKAICADSIRAVFTVGTHAGLEDYGTDAAFVRVPVLALCILVTQLLKDPPSGSSRCSETYRRSAPLLGMAAGIFGKLGMTAPFEDLFQDVAELCLVTGQWNVRGT